MDGELLTFALLTHSSLIIIVNPLGATLIYVSLTVSLDRMLKDAVAKDSCRFSLFILLIGTVLGAFILHLFGISIGTFRIVAGHPPLWHRFGNGLCKDIAHEADRNREVRVP